MVSGADGKPTGSRWEADGNRKPIENRGRRASPGSIRSPGVPRCCWPGNTVQRQSTVRCLRGSRLLCWWPSPSAEPASAGWPPPRARARSPCSCGSRGRRRGRTGFRRRGASRCRLGAAGPRALNSRSRQVRHAQPGWPPQLPEPSTPVRPPGSSLPVNPLGQLRQTQHLHPIGQRVTAVPRDHHKGLLRLEIDPGA